MKKLIAVVIAGLGILAIGGYSNFKLVVASTNNIPATYNLTAGSRMVKCSTGDAFAVVNNTGFDLMYSFAPESSTPAVDKGYLPGFSSTPIGVVIDNFPIGQSVYMFVRGRSTAITGANSIVSTNCWKK